MHSPRFRRRLVLALMLTGLGLTTARSHAEGPDWPQFRGATGQGTAPATDLPVTWSGDEHIRWKRDLPGAGTSSPITFGNQIFVTCYSGYGERGGNQEDLKLSVVALDRESGQIRWTKHVPPKLPEQDRIREGHGYASNTPIADAERVYCMFGHSGVFALDHQGKQLWQADVGDNLHGWGSAASPVLFQDLLIVNASVESESLIALNKKTGKEIWRVKGIKESWNTPIFVTPPGGGKTELVLAIFGKILGIDPATGKQLWSCDTDIGWYMVPSLVAHEGTIYCIGGRSGGGLAVKAGGQGDVTRSRRIWTIKKGSNVTSPLFHEGHIYWMHENLGIAYCADASDGKLVYEQRVQRADQIYASPVLGDGKIYYVSRSGRTFVVAAQPQFELLATNEFGDRSQFNSSPAIDGRRLLIRSDEALYCLEK